ncbi:MAG: FAD-dependent thymidylate synthase [Burkholderiales bacterium]
MTISVKLIEASTTLQGTVIITMELKYPRFIHAQMLTHRVFSRNSSSSRAIPVKKLIDNVLEDPVIPSYWGLNIKGMQAGEQINTLVRGTSREQAWQEAIVKAVDRATAFAEAGYHKQITNRLLEPFSHIKTIVTATEWDNFFALRKNELAQPEIVELATKMYSIWQEVLYNPNLTVLREYNKEWHLPYISLEETKNYDISTQIKLSVARCARVSYNKIEDNALQKDLELFYMLDLNNHLSPFEHQATAMPYYDEYSSKLQLKRMGITHIDMDNNYWSGNLRGMVQYRKYKEGILLPYST